MSQIQPPNNNNSSSPSIFLQKTDNFQNNQEEKLENKLQSRQEQFSNEEIGEFVKEKNLKKKNKENEFHFISKKEMEDKLNPYARLYADNRILNKRKRGFRKNNTTARIKERTK